MFATAVVSDIGRPGGRKKTAVDVLASTTRGDRDPGRPEEIVFAGNPSPAGARVAFRFCSFRRTSRRFFFSRSGKYHDDASKEETYNGEKRRKINKRLVVALIFFSSILTVN